MSEPRADIVCLSSIDWDFNWQGHQTIMSAFAADGDHVLFVENTGVRPPRLSDTPRLLSRMRNWRRGAGGRRQVDLNLDVLSPLVLPLPYSRWARRFNARSLLRSVSSWRGTSPWRPLVEWSFLPTPLALDLRDRLQPALVAYYCVDDLGSSSRPARRCRPSEERLLAEADLVFTASHGLRARAREFRSEVHLMPFGVDFQAFAVERSESTEPPGEVVALPRPIVGYVGGLHRWLDLDLCLTLARSMPQASLIFVGPVQADIGRLREQPNIHVLGPKPHSSLPLYLRAFDVGIIPYRLCEYTRFVYPTKMNEYLAVGLPVIATPLPEIVAFSHDHPGVVETAESEEAFVASVQRALATRSEKTRHQRIDVARGNDWNGRIRNMRELLAAGLRDRAAVGSP